MKSDKFSTSKIEKAAFVVLFAVMAVYYCWRMFALTPWYDELYTYNCFISKGPVYAAIHWPLPNNHVGYSVLSGFLDMFGNSYIGLRGVSYLCALANMVLIYRISGKIFKGILPFCTVLLYISMNLVNQMAVQGRGYTLGITCFLTAWLCMEEICGNGQVRKRLFIIYACSLTLGLYAVSSHVYWVVPLCLAGGCYLLILAIREKKENGSVFKSQFGKQLIRLIVASVAAALATVFLYTLIWLAIGSNLLVKEENSIYFGLSHIEMIMKAPFSAIHRGMEYMLDTPYIQSEERAGFLGRLGGFFVSLSNYFYGSLGKPLILIWLIGIGYLLINVFRRIRLGNREKLLSQLILLSEIVFVPICLLIQCKRPYYRVFTYGGVLLAILIVMLLNALLEYILEQGKQEGNEKKLCTVLLLLVVLWCVKCFFSPEYHAQYGQMEYEIQDAFRHGEITKEGHYCVTDCNQEYLFYFLYGIRCENRQIEGSDMVLLDKRMTDPDFTEMVWEFYHYYDTIPWKYIEENMQITYENNNYILYTRKEEENEK